MKKFTKVYENAESEKIYKITASITLEVKATNEGEAGYLADSILGGVDEHESFVIDNIEEITESMGISDSNDEETTDSEGEEYIPHRDNQSGIMTRSELLKYGQDKK